MYSSVNSNPLRAICVARADDVQEYEVELMKTLHQTAPSRSDRFDRMDQIRICIQSLVFSNVTVSFMLS